MRKPRSDAKLKTLPNYLQFQIIGHAGNHSLQETRSWLLGQGIKTSTGALSEFLSWARSPYRYRLGSDNSEIPVIIAGGRVCITKPCNLSAVDLAQILIEALSVSK